MPIHSIQSGGRATVLAIRIPSFEAVIRKAAHAGLARRPVVVATAFKPLGRVLAACPQARMAGVTEEMHFPVARDRCPDAAFLLPDDLLAQQTMEKLVGEAANFSPLVEAAAAGRVLVDTRGTEKLWGGAEQVAGMLQKRIDNSLHLPSAAGVAVCRPWSLLASRVAAEEGGICLVRPGEEDAFLTRVPLEWVDGLTPQVRTRLWELNIRTVGQLRQFEREDLLRRFGHCGDLLWEVVHPQAWSGVARTEAAGPEKSIRLEAFMTESTVELELLQQAVRNLASDLSTQLWQRGEGTARLSLTLLHADGMMKTTHTRLGGYVQERTVLADAAEDLLGRAFRRRVQVTRLQMTAEKLAAPERQGRLFADIQPGEGGNLARIPPSRRAAALDHARRCVAGVAKRSKGPKALPPPASIQ
ncbi:MAG: hypothetical protein LUC93_08405 [Planctomycetaceae bacterium]|nr:hypothetical protein [Planctomycetaceae bacterium]